MPSLESVRSLFKVRSTSNEGPVSTADNKYMETSSARQSDRKCSIPGSIPTAAHAGAAAAAYRKTASVAANHSVYSNAVADVNTYDVAAAVDTLAAGNGAAGARKYRCPSRRPSGTLPYVVQRTMKITHLAVQCSMTAAELRSINNLAITAEVVVPGQVLYVPQCCSLLLSLEDSCEGLTDSIDSVSSTEFLGLEAVDRLGIPGSDCLSNRIRSRHSSRASNRSNSSDLFLTDGSGCRVDPEGVEDECDVLPRHRIPSEDEIRIRSGFVKLPRSQLLAVSEKTVRGTVMLTFHNVIFRQHILQSLLSEDADEDYNEIIPMSLVTSMVIVEKSPAEDRLMGKHRRGTEIIYFGPISSGCSSLGDQTPSGGSTPQMAQPFGDPQLTADVSPAAEGNETEATTSTCQDVSRQYDLSQYTSQISSEGLEDISCQIDIEEAHFRKQVNVDENNPSSIKCSQEDKVLDLDPSRQQCTDGACDTQCEMTTNSSNISGQNFHSSTSSTAGNKAIQYIDNRYEDEDAKFEKHFQGIDLGFDDSVADFQKHDMIATASDVTLKPSNSFNERSHSQLVETIEESEHESAEIAAEPQGIPIATSKLGSRIVDDSSFPPRNANGSYVYPSGFKVYVNYDTGLFTRSPSDLSRVKDISTLPLPSQDEEESETSSSTTNQKPFSIYIGDSDPRTSSVIDNVSTVTELHRQNDGEGNSGNRSSSKVIKPHAAKFEKKCESSVMSDSPTAIVDLCNRKEITEQQRSSNNDKLATVFESCLEKEDKVVDRDECMRRHSNAGLIIRKGRYMNERAHNCDTENLNPEDGSLWDSECPSGKFRARCHSDGNQYRIRRDSSISPQKQSGQSDFKLRPKGYSVMNRVKAFFGWDERDEEKINSEINESDILRMQKVDDLIVHDDNRVSEGQAQVRGALQEKDQDCPSPVKSIRGDQNRQTECVHVPRGSKNLARAYNIRGINTPVNTMMAACTGRPSGKLWYLIVNIGIPKTKATADEKATLRRIFYKNRSIDSDTHATEFVPRFCFGIHKSMVNRLYRFLMENFADVYGIEDEVDLSCRDLNPYSSETDLLAVLENEEEPAALSRSDSYEEDFGVLPMPDLIHTSSILNDEHVRMLLKNLPIRLSCCKWTRYYSTSTDGYSLCNLYRTLNSVDSFCLLVIRDSFHTVFGALLPCEIRQHKYFRGNGESFLFTFKDRFKKYGWTGDNDYVLLGNKDSLCIGASNGSFGLWLDGDLNNGRTQHCETFNNDLLTHGHDFVVTSLEVWGFLR